MECSAMELRSDTKLYGNIIVAKGAGALINSSLYKTMQRPRTDDDRYISCTKKKGNWQRMHEPCTLDTQM